MLVSQGEKVHVVYRRMFDGDVRRHFVGEVVDSYETTARLQGFVFVYDSIKSQFDRKPEARTTIIDLAESGHIVNVIPRSVEIDKLQYMISAQKRLVITDNQGFALDIHEFGSNR